MNIPITLKFLYYIILLLPLLAMVTYLGQAVYHIKNRDERYKDEVVAFLSAIPTVVLYGICVVILNKANMTCNVKLIKSIIIPFVYIMLAIIYGYIITDNENNIGNKIMVSAAIPCLLIVPELMEKLLGY